MTAPDKIYVHEGAHLGMLTLTTIPVNAPGEQEYISKDALIEWAKENLQEACDEESVPFEYYENGIITGKISAFEQVIIKLNSM